MNRRNFLATAVSVPIATMLPEIANAAHYNHIARGLEYSYAPGFKSIAQSCLGVMKQENTKWAYSCGPTSLLFAMNYFYRRQYNSNASFSWYKSRTENMLRGIYASGDIVIDQNTIESWSPEHHWTSTLSELGTYAENAWSWDCYKARNIANQQYSWSVSNCLARGGLVILAFRNNEQVGDRIHRADGAHLGICYQYAYNVRNPDKSFFLTFEPYHGKFSYFFQEEMRTYLHGNGTALLLRS